MQSDSALPLTLAANIFNICLTSVSNDLGHVERLKQYSCIFTFITCVCSFNLFSLVSFSFFVFIIHQYLAMSITEKTSRNNNSFSSNFSSFCYVKRLQKHLKGKKNAKLTKRYNLSHNNMFFSVGFKFDVKIILNFDSASVFIKKVTLLY
jgi:hypothetical protein